MHIYRSFNSIKALSFDLDDTLYDNHPVIMKVESEMEMWLHSNHPVSKTLSRQQWHTIKLELASSIPSLVHDVTKLRQTQIEFGLKQLGYSDLQAKNAAQVGIEYALWLRNQVDVPNDSHLTLKALAKKYPLVAITNGNVNVEKIGLSDYFDFVLQAGPDGRSKPYSDMFSTAAKQLNLPKQNILHIGDHLISDVSGAKQSGYTTCWINTLKSPLNIQSKINVLPDIEIEHINELTEFL
ncbi:5-amino-6-(5-phospho-D-ribitylamino)uracil phosphatase YigB [Vibrio sp. TH_r3]|uniref:5-amino-6-(5-phospho-D-ribitylamino)uracil phosphatase YigB n=1 Tax=Vibrio sp. TH_r3 TaxID=3082084 RepID=UPI0029557C56|nr:5-amino-6-(5-phospho-D-ribitylamino)uracil phosphatase YigB [Vibrio sp. TH_r3]MDV7106075.1 5-amino-6-(5-phospho-D-ribitylamino)uracil phosphatase YigB [Vibrio sp. TH_r3]